MTKRVLICFALITLLKAGAFVVLAERGAAHAFVGDNAIHFFLPTAHRIIDEHRFNGIDSRKDSKAPPGYPPLIAATMVIAGSHYLPLLVVIQMLFDFGTACVLYWIANDFERPLAGGFAGAAWLVFPPAVAASTWVTSETAFAFFFLLSIRYVVQSLRDHRIATGILAGLFMGLAAFQRPTPLLLIPALLPVFLWFRAGRAWIATALAMYLLAGAWTVRNYVVLHDFIPIAVGSGSVLMNGSDESFFTIAGKAANYRAAFAAAHAAGVPDQQNELESESDAYQARVGTWILKKRIRERPLSMPGFIALKVARLFYATESGTKRTELGIGLCSLIIVPLALWQWFAWRRECATLAWTFATILLYFIAVHTVAFPEFRYMMPLFPLLTLGAVEKLWSLAGGRE